MATTQQGISEADKKRVEILRQTSMEAILEAEGFDIRHKAKGNYHSPFREDKDPSFHIDEANHRWFDHGIGKGGDTISLVMQIKNLTFNQALDYLEKFNPDLSVTSTKPIDPDQFAIKMSAALSGYVNHSGGAYGSDAAWGIKGRVFGVTSRHYYHGDKTPYGNTMVSEEEFAEGLEKVKAASVILGKNPSKPGVLDLLGRNWMQVRESDAVFAISAINDNIKHRLNSGKFCMEVEGGTGWAVQMAINEGKPVFVYDLDVNTWFQFDEEAEGCWKPLSKAPVLTKNFAGIGTRHINEIGKLAMQECYEATIRSLLLSNEEYSFLQNVDRTNKVNVWAGSNENIILSNMAIRPFVIEGKRFETVEQRFQYRKAIFFGDEIAAKRILGASSPYEAKLWGRKVKGFDAESWSKVASKEMEAAIKLSFISNPAATEELLKTGNAFITHDQGDSVWKDEFPRILMKVRESLKKTILDDNGEYHGVCVIDIREINKTITSKMLLNYETESRAIHPDILRKYCYQIKYTVEREDMDGDQKKMTFLAIGFPNRSGSWELRGAPYHGNPDGIKRSTGKDISIIDKDGSFVMTDQNTPDMIAISSSENVVVFEGFNDFMSWLSWKDQLTPENTDVVVLNSTSLLDRAIPFILNHKTVYSYLDCDKAGMKQTQAIEDNCRQKEIEFKDCSYFYSKNNFNDFNNAWVAESARRKAKGIPSKLDNQKDLQSLSTNSENKQSGSVTKKGPSIGKHS